MAARPKTRRKKALIAPAWEVNTLRFTAFAPEPIALDQKLWDRVAQFEPTSVKTLPTAIMSGSSDSGQLSMRAAGPKIDIVLHPRRMEGEPANPVASLGTLVATFPDFRNFIARYLSKKPKLTRMAFGMIAHAPVSSRTASVDLLLSQLPDVDLKNTNSVSDFFFQINRPRQSKVLADSRVNRLSRWSSVQVLMALVQMGAAEAKATSGSTEFYAKLELDVNTTAERTKLLPSTKLLPIFDELYKQAEEIGRAGDVP